MACRVFDRYPRIRLSEAVRFRLDVFVTEHRVHGCKPYPLGKADATSGPRTALENQNCRGGL